MGWSGWKADWNHDVLTRIVALLFALANVADRAAGHPARRRRKALGFVCWAEAEARAYLMGMVADAPVEADGPAFFDDAASLAARLRVLAFMLWFLAAQAGPSARPGANPRTLRLKPVGRSMPVCLSAIRDRQAAQPAPDTS